jgi:saccharopine dehydrogenase (NAD+, L-lysine-forming)
MWGPGVAMSKVLIIGAGGVGGVVAHKCAQVPEVFSEICLASRTLARCEKIKAELPRPIRTAQVDADDVPQLTALIREFQPDLVLNVALPYQDMTIMQACLETGTDYLDTANYESPTNPKFEYGPQWRLNQAFTDRGIMALLGSGFDPGVTNVFCAYAQQELFDEIHTVDIVDCNAGSHGKAFATNFNPEINIREVTAVGRYWENGEWKVTAPLSVSQDFDFPEVGVKKAFLLYHEELESLVLNLKGLKRIRFWMTFSENYLTHLRVLENVGMTRIDPVNYEGTQVIPLKFLKALLPDPASLAEGYTGKTSIGCIIEGHKGGVPKKVFIYNVCDHQECYKEVKAQAVSYTTGVPAMIGAMMMLTKKWHRPGVHNMETFPARLFLDELGKHGLPWHVKEL